MPLCCVVLPPSQLVIEKLIWKRQQKEGGFRARAFWVWHLLCWVRHVGLGKVQILLKPWSLICIIGLWARIRVRWVRHLLQVQDLRGHHNSVIEMEKYFNAILNKILNECKKSLMKKIRILIKTGSDRTRIQMKWENLSCTKSGRPFKSCTRS